MARSKRVAARIDNHSHFPIESLPLELVHEIFSYLEPHEASSLRLLGRKLAAVGVQYLVPELHLIVKQDSLDQLQAIAEHPVISQQVKSFWYEADRLDVQSFRVWEQRIYSEDYHRSIHAIHLPGARASERELRAYHRAQEKMRRTPRHRYTKAQLDAHYAMYQAYISEQDSLLKSDSHAQRISQILKRCPKIQEIYMSTEGFNRHNSRSRRLRGEAFAKGLCWAAGDEGHDLPCGLAQTRALLLGAFDAGLRLRTLSCGSMNWQILESSDDEMAKFESVLSSVRHLDIYFSTGACEDEFVDVPGPSVEIPTCNEYLKRTGRLRKLITAAPGLTSLGVGFDWDEPYCATELKHVVGDFSWHYLKDFWFNNIDTSEEDLLEFCNRHAGTLAHFTMDRIVLTKGTWDSTFHKMRRSLKLDWAKLDGVMDEEESGRILDMNARIRSKCDHDHTLGFEIEAYLMSWPDEHDWTLLEFCGGSALNSHAAFDSDDSDDMDDSDDSDGSDDSLSDSDLGINYII